MRVLDFLKKYPWILPTIIFAVLVILGANMHPLWGDEAETALFAKNILKYGVPKGWDGTNIMGQDDAVVLNQDLVNHTSPWPQYYLVAASFKIFGIGTLQARFPFIIFSILSIPLLYLICLKLTNNKTITFVSTLLLSCNVGFLLYSYQARYYALTVFFALLFIYFALRLTEGLKYKIFLIITGMVCIYSQYLTFPLFYGSFLLSYVVYLTINKKTSKEVFKFAAWYLLCGAIIVLFFLPWYLILKPTSGRTLFDFSFSEVSPELVWVLIRKVLNQFVTTGIFSPILVGLAIIVSVIKKNLNKYTNIMIFILLTVLIYFLSEITLEFFIATNTTLYSDRYNVITFPLFAIILSITIFQIKALNKYIFITLIALLIFTNTFSFQAPRSLLLEFLGEVSNPYVLPDQEVVNYLNDNTRKGETVYLTLDRDHEPLMFYNTKELKFVNRIIPTNTRVFPKGRSVLPIYTYFYTNEPDWVIQYSKRENDNSELMFDYRPLPPNINLTKDYNVVALPVFFSDFSRPEIGTHAFKETKPSYNDQIFIYHKKQS